MPTGYPLRCRDRHLIFETNWTASVYAQIEQVRKIKAKHPELPVYVYTGFGNADGYNNETCELTRLSKAEKPQFL